MASASEMSIENAEIRKRRLVRHVIFHIVLFLFAYMAFLYATKIHFFQMEIVHSVISSISAVFFGVITTALFHEWGHFFGARLGQSTYSIEKKLRGFIFGWNFTKNKVNQFYIMSVSGSMGGLISLVFLGKLLALGNPYDRLVLISAFSAFVFGAAIEWPVILRTLKSNNPYNELSKTTPKVLMASLLISILSGAAAYNLDFFFAT